MIEPTSRLFASIAIAVAALGRALAAPPIPNPDALPIGVSRVLWEISVPADVAPTPQKVALGEKLFNDVRLSTNDKVSCATCHDPAKGFVDGKPLAEGVAAPKEKTKRHSPTVLNAVFNATQFWDGRAATLEDQAKLPITNPIEMGQKDGQAVMTKVLAIPEYATAFKETFGREGTFDDLAAAIAAFERTQVSSQAAFDRFVAGDENAISPAAKRGWGLFNGKARCNTCHAFSTTNPDVLGPALPQHRHRRAQDGLHRAGRGAPSAS
jgi:cytochrome c peroxidase